MPNSFGDTKPEAVAEWNKRNPADLSQVQIKTDDKPPFVARCGNLMLLVEALSSEHEGQLICLHGEILEGKHFSDDGDYGFGDVVTIGPITSHWRKVSVI